MRIELEDNSSGHLPVTVVATEKKWQIYVGEEPVLTMPSAGTAAAVYRTLGKVLEALENLS